MSDRYRVVDAFLQAAKTSPTAGNDSFAYNVKFNSRAQGVTSETVTAAMRGDRMGQQEMASYRVVLDIDGNANAWESLRWKLGHGAPVIKAKSLHYIQWYYPLLTHGKELWVPPIDRIVADAMAVARNETLCEELSDRAHAFALRHLAHGAAKASLLQCLGNLSQFRTPARWAIAGQP